MQQNIAVMVLSQVTSAWYCERRSSTFIHTKERNRLACEIVKNIVKVLCNLDSIDEIGQSDADIDWISNKLRFLEQFGLKRCVW